MKTGDTFMPTYDYHCDKCGHDTEIFHMMSDESRHLCPECNAVMTKQISSGYLASGSFKPTLADMRESEHTKKVTDKERAIKSRKKAFGHDAVGDPVDKPDPEHAIRAKVLAGSEQEVDKGAFIKAAAKDPATVELCKNALNKQNKLTQLKDK